MTSRKIIEKLFNIASKQQEIIIKLAQGTSGQESTDVVDVFFRGPSRKDEIQFQKYIFSDISNFSKVAPPGKVKGSIGVTVNVPNNISDFVVNAIPASYNNAIYNALKKDYLDFYSQSPVDKMKQKFSNKQVSPSLVGTNPAVITFS
jgi:AMMECR1 domain-containing protein